MKTLYPLLLMLFVSCTPAPYLIVQYPLEYKVLCRDHRGYEVYAYIECDCNIEPGDTLYHAGGFRYEY